MAVVLPPYPGPYRTQSQHHEWKIYTVLEARAGGLEDP